MQSAIRRCTETSSPGIHPGSVSQFQKFSRSVDISMPVHKRTSTRQRAPEFIRDQHHMPSSFFIRMSKSRSQNPHSAFIRGSRPMNPCLSRLMMALAYVVVLFHGLIGLYSRPESASFLMSSTAPLLSIIDGDSFR